jgi:hypothetical protein
VKRAIFFSKAFIVWSILSLTIDKTLLKWESDFGGSSWG